MVLVYKVYTDHCEIGPPMVQLSFVMAGGSGKSKQQKSNMAAKFVLYKYHVDEYN
jgi:hypothetical protein